MSWDLVSSWAKKAPVWASMVIGTGYAMDWYLATGVLAVVIPSLYIYTASVVSTRFPMLRDKRICILIAHPDDEAMFFAPAVLALTRPETGNHVKILCLSSGMSSSLGRASRPCHRH